MEIERIRIKDVIQKYPFLADLFRQAQLYNSSKYCRVTFKIDEPLDITAPFHDGCCRYTSRGSIDANNQLKVSSHYAGCYDTCLCNPVEVLGAGTQDKIVKENSFYAIFDLFEHWKSRHVTVYLRSINSKLVGETKLIGQEV